MLKTISPEDMREMEGAFMKTTGYPSLLLMEHAAEAVAEKTRSMADGGSALFICGSGNNGGDGCAAARIFAGHGGKAYVWLTKGPLQMQGEAGLNARLLNSCNIASQVLYDTVPEIPQDVTVIVDALFGTGLSRNVEGLSAALIDCMNASGLPIIAVDIPSGIDGASGHEMGTSVHAVATVTFHRAKHGHFLYPGRERTGKLEIADIGIPSEWDGAQGIEVLEDEDAGMLLPERPRDGHKGTFGHVLCVAGSSGMAGAALLCTTAALRAGAGLVTAACPQNVASVLQMQAPCAMTRTVTTNDFLTAADAEALLKLAEGKKALAIGPGLGRQDDTWEAIAPLIASDIPKVIDADALVLLARHHGVVGNNTVMTPHPGEMARLCDAGVVEVLSTPVDVTQRLASEMDACVLLKGATTVICHGLDLSMNITGCNGMGTGGSGDVLTGIIASLMAQGASPYDAARLGAFYHGRAGEAAEHAMGSRAMTAMDICTFLHM